MTAVTIITALPTFVSPEDHRSLVASTPDSFANIPPVLKHKEEGVSVSLDPSLPDFAAQDGLQGTLYVLTSVLAFVSTTGKGFQIEYPSITLHAVSRGESGPSIYCQLDESVPEATLTGNTDEEEVTDMRELIIVPKNPESLETIFEALSQCASLHPDPIGDDDELDDAFIDENGSAFETFTGDDNEELSEVGRAALAHLESIIYDPHNLQPEDSHDEVDADDDHKKGGQKESNS